MTHGYLAKHARQCGVKLETKGYDGIVGCHADYTRRDFFAARTQREAGIERHTWEDRLKPLRPWLHDICAGAAWVLFAISAFWAASKVVIIL